MTDLVDRLTEGDEATTSGETSDRRLVIPLGSAKSTGLVPLAFTISKNLQPILVDGLAIAWTKEAIATFSKIREVARARDTEFEHNLPYASLRGLIEVIIPKVAGIERGMGLDPYALDPRRKEPAPFVFIDNNNIVDVRASLRPLLDDWIAHFLVPQYLNPGDVPQRLRARVEELAESDELLSIQKVHTRLLPWNAGPTGTAAPPDARGFSYWLTRRLGWRLAKNCSEVSDRCVELWLPVRERRVSQS